MKELFDDRITQRIKDLLEQYEPAYSPQAWQKLRKQMPPPESRLKKLLLKYKFWLSGLAIVGVLVTSYKVTDRLPGDKNSVIDPLSFESASYFATEKPREITYPEKTSALKQNISDNITGQQEKSVFPEATLIPPTESMPGTNQDNTQAGSAITEIPEIPESIERASVIPVSPERIDFGYQYNNTLLIPIEDRAADNKTSKDQSYNKTGNFEFHWPGFNSSLTKDGDYNKFVGPNKLAFFYSPEIHYSDSIGNMGVSQGIGITLWLLLTTG